MKNDGRGIFCVLATALCFAAIPAMAKTAYAGGASVLSLLSIRYLLAAATTAIELPVLKRNFEASFGVC